MEEQLKKMGFKNITGGLWRHHIFGAVQFQNEDSPSTIAHRIFIAGQYSAKEEIRKAIGIK